MRSSVRSRGPAAAHLFKEKSASPSSSAPLLPHPSRWGKATIHSGRPSQISSTLRHGAARGQGRTVLVATSRHLSRMPTHVTSAGLRGATIGLRHAQTLAPWKWRFLICFVPQQEGWVVQRFGKFTRVLEPGLNFLSPFDSVAYRHSLKMVTLEIPNQVGITKDNVNIDIDGILYYRVVDPVKASYDIDDPQFAIQQLAMSTMRVEVGKLDLDRIFEEREIMNKNIVSEINRTVENWGLHCDRYEIRDIKPPETAMKAMELQMVAERRRRQKVITSEADRTATVNKGEGDKAAAILNSEARRTEKLLLAEGEALAIKLRADATAAGLERIAKALKSSGGREAAGLLVAEQYVSAFGQLAQRGNSLVLPANAGDVAGMVAQSLKIYQTLSTAQAKAAEDGANDVISAGDGSATGQVLPALTPEEEIAAQLEKKFGTKL